MKSISQIVREKNADIDAHIEAKRQEEIQKEADKKHQGIYGALVYRNGKYEEPYR